MTGRLEDRKILVVGAGTQRSDEDDAPPGNGRAISVLGAREGASIACADIDADATAETARLVRNEGAAAVEIVGNVADADDCARIVDEAIAGLGGLDGVVLNVGIASGVWLDNTSPEAWDSVLSINTRAHFLIARSALARMDDGGAFVFISSVAGLRPGSRSPAYDTSKAALAGLSRHVAFEGARRNIRANVVAPGLIDTPLGRLATRGRPGRAKTPVPLGRQGTAWEVAAPVVFLLSDGASYITGQLLAVDGGLSGL